MTTYGPHNPHPLSQMRTELVWEGKYDEFGNRREIDVAGLSMPLQKIETIDEPRSRAEAQGSLFDEQKAHRDDFRNRLIWGDNKLVMASLLEEFKGAIDLIYIDPPFDVGADFTMNVPVGDEREVVTKDPSLLETVVYRDIWGRGTDSYLAMLYGRLLIMSELLSESGSIFVHVGPNVSHFVRSILVDVFGSENYRNEIIWRRAFAHNDPNRCGNIHDCIFYFTKSNRRTWNTVLQKPSSEYVEQFFDQYDPVRKERYARHPLDAPRHGDSGNLVYEWKGVWPSANRTWAYKKEQMEQFDREDRIHYPKSGKGKPRLKRYESEYEGTPLQDIWTDINKIHNQSSELLGYSTQKPEALLERIVLSASDENDLVGDFFCGSGTTQAVAEKLGRRWIGCDLGRYSIHTTRKRLIGLQRHLHEAGTPYRSFDVYNLGRYERQWWQQDALEGAEDEHRAVVLKFFRAEILSHAPSPLIHGRKGGMFVHVDGIDSIFMRDEATEVARAVKAAGGREVHCLAWDFEMDIRQAVAAIEAEFELTMRLHRIPREIMEKNRTEVPPFYEVALLTAEPVVKKSKDGITVDIKLTNFLPSLTEVPARELDALEERAVESGFDFIDFWAVDFDWSPGQPFNHHWQDYRTRKDRSLKTVSDAAFTHANAGKRIACVKVVDVFGCDTSITVEIEP